MKINRLVIHNIASIIDTTIDFTTYPLAGESIFLITGNTGSGKTTVLNAICMALYDKVPALYNASGDKDIAGMSINSAMQLARRDAADCSFVSLRYEGKDRRQYEITWRLNKVTRGVNKGEFKNRPERILARLDDEGWEEATFTSVKEIDAMVLKTVDLTFDQFCRTTMLAQGQFLKFLESSEREKCEILEKLTGTEIYKRIGEEVNALYKASEAEYAEMNRRLEEVTNQLLGDEVLAKMQAEGARLSNEIAELQSAMDEARRQIAWLEAAKRLEESLEQSKLRLAKAQANDVGLQRKKLEAWDATAEIRELLKRKKALADEHNKLERRREELAADAALVHMGLAELRDNLEKTRQCTSDIDKELATHEGSVGIYNRLGEIRIVAESISADLAAANECDGKAEALRASLSESAKKLAEREGLVAKAKSEWDEAKGKHAGLEDEKKKYDISEINGRKTRLVSYKEVLANLANARSLHEERSRTLEREQSALDAKRQELEQAYKALPALEKGNADAQANFKTMSDRLQGQMDLKDKLAQLKKIFHEEKRCPLCGSTDGHICADSVISLAVEEAQKKADEAAEKWQAAQALLNEAKAEIKSLKKEISKRENDLKIVSEQASKAASQLEKAKKDADCSEAGGLGVWIEARMAETNSLIDACDRKHGEASQAIDRCAKSQQLLDSLRKKYDEENDIMQSLRLKAEKDSSDMKRLGEMASSKRDEARLSAAKLADMLPDGYPLAEPLRSGELPSDLDCCIERMESGKREYDNLLDKKKSAADALKSLQDKIEDIQSMLDDMSDLKPSHAPGLHSHGDVAEMSRALRDNYIEFVALLNNNAEESSAVAERETEYFQANDREKTLALLDVLEGAPGEADAADWRKAVQEHDSELKTAREFVESGEKTLGEHAGKRPEKMAEDASIGDVSEHLSLLAEKHRRAIEESTRLDAALKRNDELKQKAGMELPKLKAMEAEYLEWKEIDGMFGTTKSRNEFGVIAQRFIFNQLLERANEYLNQLNPRYSLKCRLDSMQIYVVDRYLGDAERVANGLSGGEGFIASLSLALALSSINTEREGVDTIFIDEGFGTLSSDLLQTVIDMLDRLQCGLGRRVGVISHIDFLKERIHTKICVEPVPGKSASTVTVVAE